MAIDADKLQEFLGRFIADLGATVAAGQCGDRSPRAYRRSRSAVTHRFP